MQMILDGGETTAFKDQNGLARFFVNPGRGLVTSSTTNFVRKATLYRCAIGPFDWQIRIRASSFEHEPRRSACGSNELDLRTEIPSQPLRPHFRSLKQTQSQAKLHRLSGMPITHRAVSLERRILFSNHHQNWSNNVTRQNTDNSICLLGRHGTGLYPNFRFNGTSCA